MKNAARRRIFFLYKSKVGKEEREDPLVVNKDCPAVWNSDAPAIYYNKHKKYNSNWWCLIAVIRKLWASKRNESEHKTLIMFIFG